MYTFFGSSYFWALLCVIHKLTPTILKHPHRQRKIHDNQYKRNSFPKWNRAFYCGSHTPPLDPLISQFNSDHVATNHFLRIHFHIVLFLVNTLSVRRISSLRVTLWIHFNQISITNLILNWGKRKIKLKKNIYSWWIITNFYALSTK